LRKTICVPEHDPEKWVPVFRKDHAQKMSWSAMKSSRSRSDRGADVTLPHIDGEIRDGRHHMQVRVYYEDTDFSDWTLS
jgi:hypothetical protein